MFVSKLILKLGLQGYQLQLYRNLDQRGLSFR